jgi:CheY-like chemotaxis protein
VEDNEDNIVLLKTQLEESGYDVIIAGDGKQGVAMAQKESPALILMDMRMPVMDGWEATKVLKGAPETRDIPIIGLSAHAMADDRDKALDAGCDDYVTKPVDLPMLLNKLKQLLS